MKPVVIIVVEEFYKDFLCLTRHRVIITVKGFILEETDDFEREVEKLSNSGKFMAFLGEISREKETVPIEDIAKKLGIKTDY